MDPVRRNPSDVFPPYPNYAHAVEVPTGARTLYVSGLNGYAPDGTTIGDTFEEQVEQTWDTLERILADADMSVADLVSLRFYLAEPAFDPANVEILSRRLGDTIVARTVVCCRLLEPEWLVEIEAIAASSTHAAWPR